ncbi:MAG: cell wall protein [Stackebrandtia sp.]
MTTAINRRRVLTGAVLGGAAIVGASTLGALSPEAVFAEELADVPEPGAPDPNFAEGIVTDVSDGVISATGSDGKTMWRIRATEATSVWKLTPSNLDNVEVGDGLYARGVRMDDGSLAADSVWVNIVNLSAHVESVSDNTLHLVHNDDHVVARVVPDVTAAVYNGTPAISDISMVKVNTHVQVVGAWIPGTNEVEISTVYAHSHN